MTTVQILLASQLVTLGLLLWLLLRKPAQPDFSPLLFLFEQVQRNSERSERRLLDEIAAGRATTSEEARRDREEMAAALQQFRDGFTATLKEMSSHQQSRLTSLLEQLARLTDANEKRLEALRETVEQRLQAIQQNNSAQLEQMRATVDEKLQGTLEKRLGESFRQVSERLELVHKGLGEMQALAVGVGDLKRVLSNVKTRGTWGEVQLAALLEQVLAPDQYAANVATKGGNERVEFAIKLPGRHEKEGIVWLPIDAKFPVESWQRLLEAHDNCDPAAAEVAARELEIRIKGCAKDICEKYLTPPTTTDFGILFLPVEGLFAEVIRRSGLAETVQRDYRVIIAGPTTLWSILNSLQMGFRTLAIEQRSSEVWTLLGAVRTEWGKYGDILTKVQKKLTEASNTIDEAQKRSRAIGRKLRDVQELPASESQALLKLAGEAEEEE